MLLEGVPMKNNQIIEKIIKEIDNMHQLPKNILKFGTAISFLLFLGAAFVLGLNNIYFNNNTLMYNCIFLMKASSSIFAEVVISGLIIDFIIKNYPF